MGSLFANVQAAVKIYRGWARLRRVNRNRDDLYANWNRNDLLNANETGRMILERLGHYFHMQTYNNLYQKLGSYSNLERAYKKARKGKASKDYVKEFELNLKQNILQLKKELEIQTYRPKPLVKFIIRDPKTRVIRKSDFRDRVVHHALVNILEPIYETIFINDSYANRLNKGTSAALKQLGNFKAKLTRNGILINEALHNNMVKGYVFKADIKHFFDSVDQRRLLEILAEHIKDKKVLRLAEVILGNFDNPKTGMPLGNMTSQFFANVYLNKLDYFIKHKLKLQYYIRYVDDFIILHDDKTILEVAKDKIESYLKFSLGLKLHPDKSKIFSLHRGVTFLGYRNFYHHRLLRKRNLNYFHKKLESMKVCYKQGSLTKEKLMERVNGWFAYAGGGGATYKLRKRILKEINSW